MERRGDIRMAAFAHDLRTPMCVAAGAAQMALDAGGKDVSAQLRQILQAVSTMDRMLSAMSGMQESSGVFTGNMLRGELLAMTQGRAQAKGPKLSIDLSALDAMTLDADYGALCRLLINLLGNAVKYALPGTRVYLDLLEMDGKVIISMKNISREELNVNADELMERFVRGDTSRNTEGSGLGLNIAQSLMELQHGQLQILVDGDLFKVTLIFPGA